MIKRKNGSYVYKDYILTPCTNINNSKISYWLSKAGYTIAVYSFSSTAFFDVTNEGIEKHIKATIPYFEDVLRRIKDAK